MTGDSEICSIAKAAEIFCGRWTALILHALAAGATRFSELDRALPLTSRSLLARRLKQLQEEGIIARRRGAGGRGWTYHLTPAGQAFLPLVAGLDRWGRRWARRELAENEVDVELLVWNIETGVQAAAFGDGRTVVLLEFTDQPQNKRWWWLINEDGHAHLCLEDPGFDVDLHLAATLQDMTGVWRGDISLLGAIETGRLETTGPQRLKRALPAWLNAGSR